MAITAPTRAGTAGEFGNAVNSEHIDAGLVLAVNTPFSYDYVARRGMDLTGKGSLTFTEVMYSKIAAAASVADGAEPSPVALANTQAQVTAAMYMQHVFIGYQSQGLIVTDGGEFAVAINRVVDAVRTKIDTDLLGLAASLTDTDGDAATPNTFENMVAALNRFRASAKDEMAAFSLHSDAYGDFLLDLLAIAPAASERGASTIAALTEGKQGPKAIDLLGSPVIVTDRMPVGDTTGWTNSITAMGPTSPFGLTYRKNEGIADVAMLADRIVPVHVKVLESDTSPGHYIRAWAHHGVGIMDQARGVNFITRAT